VLRELGRYHALFGHLQKALRVTEKSRQVAESDGARYEQALSALACAEYRRDLGQIEPGELERAAGAASEFERQVEQLRGVHPFLSSRGLESL
jgi:hypothetical protein